MMTDEKCLTRPGGTHGNNRDLFLLIFGRNMLLQSGTD